MEESFLKKLIKNPKKISILKFDEIKEILHKARNYFKKENLLLEFDVNNPEEEVYIIGDIHGNLETLTKFLDLVSKEEPKLIISLGDIVDRGQFQIECLIIALIFKILNPERFFILRGNHETLEMNKNYGFYYEFLEKFKDVEKFKEIISLYDVLPICAIINGSILCLHGGIPENFEILNQIRGLKNEDITKKNIDDSTLKSIDNAIFQILWNDPKEGLQGFMESYRGPGIKFYGEGVFNEFMQANNLKYLIRAHEAFEEGYRWFFEGRLLSIFSSADYKGDYFPNPASFAIIKNNRLFPKTLE